MAWYTLPTEMKLAVVECLDIEDAKSFAQVDRQAYTVCVPALFKNVKLPSYASLMQFLAVVPPDYCKHIHSLDVTTALSESFRLAASPETITKAVGALLEHCLCLHKLVLRLHHNLHHDIIPSFPRLGSVKSLSIINCGLELSLSERLIVSIAASVPLLENLELDHVSRSLMHAPDLLGAYPSVPLAIGDEDIPDHPTLGSELSLPSLLRIPTLQKLSIRDTHLGDPRWSSVAVQCRLQVVDLGSCSSETDDANRVFQERIMTAVGRTINEFTLSTSVSGDVFTRQSATPMQRLRKLHIAPFFPVESVVDTMTTLSGSPVETLSVQCYDDDTVDVCAAIEEFLSVRVARGPHFYGQLAHINVSVILNGEDTDADFFQQDSSERADAIKRLQDFCRDLHLVTTDSSECQKAGETYKKAVPTCNRPEDVGKFII